MLARLSNKFAMAPSACATWSGAVKNVFAPPVTHRSSMASRRLLSTSITHDSNFHHPPQAALGHMMGEKLRLRRSPYLGCRPSISEMSSFNTATTFQRTLSSSRRRSKKATINANNASALDSKQSIQTQTRSVAKTPGNKLKGRVNEATVKGTSARKNGGGITNTSKAGSTPKASKSGKNYNTPVNIFSSIRTFVISASISFTICTATLPLGIVWCSSGIAPPCLMEAESDNRRDE